MATKTSLVFKGLNIISWIIFVGLCIEAGGLIVNFFFSVYKPESVKYLYQKLDLSELYNRSKWVFYSMYLFVLFISLLKAYLFYVLIRLLSRLNLSRPFSSVVCKEITVISYFTFSIGLLSYIAGQTAMNLRHQGYETDQLNEFWADGQAFVLMAAVVYVIASIFRRGVEIQHENDLTV